MESHTVEQKATAQAARSPVGRFRQQSGGRTAGRPAFWGMMKLRPSHHLGRISCVVGAAFGGMKTDRRPLSPTTKRLLPAVTVLLFVLIGFMAIEWYAPLPLPGRALGGKVSETQKEA